MSQGRKPGRCVMKYACVLVADDNHDNALAYAKIFRESRYQVICVFDGTWALEVTEKRLPGLSVINYGMPGLDGLAVTRRLREGAATKDMKIVVTSSTATAREPAQRAGADAFIRCPMETGTLLRVVSALMPWQMSIECG